MKAIQNFTLQTVKENLHKNNSHLQKMKEHSCKKRKYFAKKINTLGKTKEQQGFGAPHYSGCAGSYLSSYHSSLPLAVQCKSNLSIYINFDPFYHLLGKGTKMLGKILNNFITYIQRFNCQPGESVYL